MSGEPDNGAGSKRSGCAWIVIIALGILLALVILSVVSYIVTPPVPESFFESFPELR